MRLLKRWTFTAACLWPIIASAIVWSAWSVLGQPGARAGLVVAVNAIVLQSLWIYWFGRSKWDERLYHALDLRPWDIERQ